MLGGMEGYHAHRCLRLVLYPCHCLRRHSWSFKISNIPYQTLNSKHIFMIRSEWYKSLECFHSLFPSFNQKALNPTNMTKTGACTPKLRHKNCKWTPQHGQPKHPKRGKLWRETGYRNFIPLLVIEDKKLPFRNKILRWTKKSKPWH